MGQLANCMQGSRVHWGTMVHSGRIMLQIIKTGLNYILWTNMTKVVAFLINRVGSCDPPNMGQGLEVGGEYSCPHYNPTMG